MSTEEQRISADTPIDRAVLAAEISKALLQSDTMWSGLHTKKFDPLPSRVETRISDLTHLAIEHFYPTGDSVFTYRQLTQAIKTFDQPDGLIEQLAGCWHEKMRRPPHTGSQNAPTVARTLVEQLSKWEDLKRLDMTRIAAAMVAELQEEKTKRKPPHVHIDEAALRMAFRQVLYPKKDDIMGSRVAGLRAPDFITEKRIGALADAALPLLLPEKDILLRSWLSKLDKALAPRGEKDSLLKAALIKAYDDNKDIFPQNFDIRDHVDGYIRELSEKLRDFDDKPTITVSAAAADPNAPKTAALLLALRESRSK